MPRLGRGVRLQKKIRFPLLSNIVNFFREKEETPVGSRFIEGIEILYSIILACGVVEIINILHGDFISVLASSWHTILISCFFLLRFFFAPCQNLRILGDNAKGWKWTLIPFDGIFILFFSFAIYFMFINIANNELFYSIFFYLLFADSVWIMAVLLRTRYIGHNKVWLWNNLFFVSLYLVLSGSWELWFILALTNSLIDLVLMYSEYFKS